MKGLKTDTKKRSIKRQDDRWKELEIWRISDELAMAICQAPRAFPSEEMYGLTSQLRRAALSIPTNIAEGCSRMGNRELARYTIIAYASLGEVKSALLLSKDGLSFCGDL